VCPRNAVVQVMSKEAVRPGSSSCGKNAYRPNPWTARQSRKRRPSLRSRRGSNFPGCSRVRCSRTGFASETALVVGLDHNRYQHEPSRRSPRQPRARPGHHPLAPGRPRRDRAASSRHPRSLLRPWSPHDRPPPESRPPRALPASTAPSSNASSAGKATASRLSVLARPQRVTASMPSPAMAPTYSASALPRRSASRRTKNRALTTWRLAVRPVAGRPKFTGLPINIRQLQGPC